MSPEINDSLIRATAREAEVIANHILDCRQRLQALSNKIYSQLALADPVADRDFEKFLLHLCKAINSLYDAAPVAHWAEALRSFHLPHPEQVAAPEPISPCAASIQSIPSNPQEPAPCNA